MFLVIMAKIALKPISKIPEYSIIETWILKKRNKRRKKSQ